jgi:hypothetical protein
VENGWIQAGKGQQKHFDSAYDMEIDRGQR